MTPDRLLLDAMLRQLERSARAYFHAAFTPQVRHGRADEHFLVVALAHEGPEKDFVLTTGRERELSNHERVGVCGAKGRLMTEAREIGALLRAHPFFDTDLFSLKIFFHTRGKTEPRLRLELDGLAVSDNPLTLPVLVSRLESQLRSLESRRPTPGRSYFYSVQECRLPARSAAEALLKYAAFRSPKMIEHPAMSAFVQVWRIEPEADLQAAFTAMICRNEKQTEKTRKPAA